MRWVTVIPMLAFSLTTCRASTDTIILENDPANALPSGAAIPPHSLVLRNGAGDVLGEVVDRVHCEGAISRAVWAFPDVSKQDLYEVFWSRDSESPLAFLTRSQLESSSFRILI
jgi:hypothetical protein